MKQSTKYLLLTLLLLPLLVHAKPVDFSLPGLDGQQYQLSDYRGKWVLVNFWATWCPPCLEEMPDLEIFHNKHKNDKAVVLGINMEDISQPQLKKFVEQQFVSYPILIMNRQSKLPFGRVQGLPTSFLIAPDGSIVARQVGVVTASAIEKFMQSYEVKN